MGPNALHKRMGTFASRATLKDRCALGQARRAGYWRPEKPIGRGSKG